MTMNAGRRISLDNAATSFPKPAAVWDAVDAYQQNNVSPVGRGSHRRAGETQSIVDRARRNAAEFLGAPSPQHVIFTSNGTDSLNLAIHGLLVPGDHVVVTALEHNSVLRPLRTLHDQGGIEVTIVFPNERGIIEPAAIKDALQANTRLVAATHASNVTGVIQPIAEIADAARAGGAIVLVDAAQTAGHIPTRLDDLNADLLACPGHKGLMAPLGTGLLVVAKGLESHLRSVRQGGTGSKSEDDQQPELLPDKYESGNHNAPGLVGLDAALSELTRRGLDDIRRHEIEILSQLLEGLRGVPGVRLRQDHDAKDRVGVVSLTLSSLPPQEAAAILDEHFGIETRAGLHCAPGAHRTLGTLEQGGTLRLSPGAFTTSEEIDLVIDAVRALETGS